jgi:hypothetical protein
MRRLWLLGVLALAVAGCRSSDPPAAGPGQEAPPASAPGQARGAPRAAAAPAFIDVEPGLDALRTRFQADDGMVRVIMLVAPT